MSRDKKLVEKLRRRPVVADFRDLERLLLGEGWDRVRQSGSHVSFKKSGFRTITVPLVGGRKVKGVYISEVLKLLGLDEES